MKVNFFGAAGTVTGSMHLVEAAGKRILLDCGLFQGPRAEARMRNMVLPDAIKSIDAVILSHGHLDREFTRVVGLSPRALTRILRMRRLLATP